MSQSEPQAQPIQSTSPASAAAGLIESTRKVFVRGPFGAGKSTLAQRRVEWLLAQRKQGKRLRGSDILVLVPQRTNGLIYQEALRTMAPAASPVLVTTVSSIARQSVELYWPLIAEGAGFADATREPVFLTLESTQFFMAELVDPALEAGEFAGVVVNRNRIISQIVDNLNKAAINRLAIDELYDRLERNTHGEKAVAQINALRGARRISHEFRAKCLAESLLDYSLQLHLFDNAVLTNEWCRTRLFRTHDHLIADNLEEDTPVAHRFVGEWLPSLESALLCCDEGAGIRSFLGADPQGAFALAALCDETITLTGSFVMGPEIAQVAQQVERVLAPRGEAAPGARSTPVQDFVAEAFVLPFDDSGATFRFYPQMVRWAAAQIGDLVQKHGVSPAEIAVVAPFVSDSLRFSLQNALSELGVASISHRPSRALEAEPAARCMITLAKLAHPQWEDRPPHADAALAFALALEGLDPVRASLLAKVVYPKGRQGMELGRFADFDATMRRRITYSLGEAYDGLRNWVYAWRARSEVLPLDIFFASLFGELLSRPGYGFHQRDDLAAVANTLVESARKLRWALEPALGGESAAGTLGPHYVSLVESGVLSALYLSSWQEQPDAVLIAPAFTFLVRNRAVDYQFWLDVGASGWWERLYQPLTHPYLLSHRWESSVLWSDADETETRQGSMRKLVVGLLRRTRRKVYLGISEYSETGYEQKGPLLALVNRLLANGRG